MNKEVIKELSAKAREDVAATRIVSGQREMTWLPEAFEEKFFQLATEWAAEREREQIHDEWSMCVQSDLEHGVKSLNERAAMTWQKEYPEISKFGEWLRARGETK